PTRVLDRDALRRLQTVQRGRFDIRIRRWLTGWRIARGDNETEMSVQPAGAKDGLDFVAERAGSDAERERGRHRLDTPGGAVKENTIAGHERLIDRRFGGNQTADVFLAEND